MKKFFALILILISFFTSCNCAFARKKTVQQMREMQTHVFDQSDNHKVMLAAVNTLQDSGFIVEEIDFNLGFIRAKKDFKEKFSNKRRVLGWSTVVAAAGAYTAFSYGTTVGTMINPTRRVMYELRDKTVEVNANVLVQPYDEDKTSVRFVFVEKVLQNADGFAFRTQAPTKIIRINKPAPYNEFFSQIEEKL